MSRALENIIRIAFESFQGWSRSEIARPKAMIAVGNRKEIICLARPSSIGFVQGIEIAWRSGIENIHITSIQLLGERRDLVAILTERKPKVT